MRPDRLARFRAAAPGVDGAVLARPASLTYLTGRADGLAVVGPERVVLVAPGAPPEGASDGATVFGYAVPGSTLDRVADVGAGAAEALGRALERAGLDGRRVGVEADFLTARQAGAVAARATAVPLGDEIEALRRVKDAGELELIRAAVAVNDVGFAAAARAIRPGATELAVQAAVVAAMQEASGQPIGVLDPTNAFISGPRTMLAAAGPTDRRLEPGDLMIVDLNPVVRGYKGDATRTFCVGPPSAEQRRVHASLVRGLEAAEAVARPGLPASQLFAALLGPIAAAGFAEGFLYHGGHALGLEHPERPYVIPGDAMPLAEGMVLALEPGVYLPGLGGLRVEDDYVVTASGLERLSRAPRDLIAAPAA